MKEQIYSLVLEALEKLKIEVSDELRGKIAVTYPDPKLGDYATNAALILAKSRGQQPTEVAQTIADKIPKDLFEKVEVAGAGFINFRLRNKILLKIWANPSPGASRHPLPEGEGGGCSSLLPTGEGAQRADKGKILLEYFQPNIAKPLHIGHLRTAIIGDAIKRMLRFMGFKVESDTHMGDWGTQFGYLILAFKKYGKVDEKLYAQLNSEAEKDPSIHQAAKLEFAKLEQGDEKNRKIWREIIDESVDKFLGFIENFGILPFEHHWPESFYEDKMPEIVETLKVKKLLKSSQSAQIVDLEDQGLGIAVIIKSDGATTYLLRDLATFMFVKQQGFSKHLYVVDNRQSLHYKQLFTILKLMKETVNLPTGQAGSKQEAEHIDYGFVSFKGEVLSTRKGNMVLAEDVIVQAKEKVGKIIEEKNPSLKNKQRVIDAVAKAALKYFDLKHNRRSDIEFNWDEVLDFEGDSGPYLLYAYARLSSILRRAEFPISNFQFPNNVSMTNTERDVLFKLSILPEIVSEALQDYLPNILAHYLYNLATLLNKFYHESPVIAEKDEKIRNFRLALVSSAKNVLNQGLNLLGIEAVEEM